MPDTTTSATLNAIDVDGAIRENLDAVEIGGDTRAEALKKAAIGGGAFLGGLGALASIPAIAAAATSSTITPRNKRNDLAILNFALTLEYLEASFYTQAIENRILTDGPTRLFADVTNNHEVAHVKFLRSAIRAFGGTAVAKPKFDFKDAVTNQEKFRQTAVVLEDTGVRAYQGQAGLIKLTPVLRAAISIHPIEARHAAWIRAIVGMNPAPDTFNPAATKRQILREVGATGFIVG